MFFSKRLTTIASFVKEGSNVADIGADHGKLEMLLKDKCKSILAVENKVGPYLILEENVKQFRNVKTSLSNGLKEVSNDFETLVIAGMGGLNIETILDEFPDKVKAFKYIVIDAHRDLEIARKSVVKNGFKFVSEKIVFENKKFYVISLFEKTEKVQEYNEETYIVGYHLENDELWPKYCKHLINQNNKTIKGLKKSKNSDENIAKLEAKNMRLTNYGKN